MLFITIQSSNNMRSNLHIHTKPSGHDAHTAKTPLPAKLAAMVKLLTSRSELN